MAGTNPSWPGRASRVIRVLIADHQELIRMGLRAMLGREVGLSIEGEAGTLAEAVAETRRVRPDLLLLDAHLPNGSDAGVFQRLFQENPKTRILIMTGDKGPGVFRETAKTGAHGVVRKDIGRAELLQAIRLVAGGDFHFDSIGLRQVSRVLYREGPQKYRSELSLLSPQERRILPLLAEGKTNHEIAVELTLAKPTIKNYLSNMFKKLNISRRSQAVALYLQAQLHRTW